MRYLALTTLAADRTELSYVDIAQALDIQEFDVELWVIRAINLKLLDAKISQLDQLISIKVRICDTHLYTTERYFI